MIALAASSRAAYSMRWWNSPTTCGPAAPALAAVDFRPRFTTMGNVLSGRGGGGGGGGGGGDGTAIGNAFAAAKAGSGGSNHSNPSGGDHSNPISNPPAETSASTVNRATGAPSDAGRPASGKRGERIAAAKAAMKDQLIKDGVPEAHAEEAANQLAGQALAESDLNPSQSHDGGTGHGIYGARNERRAAMDKWLAEKGYDKNSLEGQSRYMAHEAMTSKDYGKTRAALMGATPENRAATTDAVTRNFERPARSPGQRRAEVAAAPSTAAGAPGTPGAKVASIDPSQVLNSGRVGWHRSDHRAINNGREKSRRVRSSTGSRCQRRRRCLRFHHASHQRTWHG